MSEIQLFLGDSLNIMRNIPDKSFDLLFTDPPYGTTKASWDKVPEKKYFDEMFRISKMQIIFGGNWFDLPKKDGWIIWNKQPFLKTTNHCELLWTSLLKKNKVIDFIYAGNCVGSKRPDYSRPKVFFTSEKPPELLELIIKEFCYGTKTVIDPFMGTGSCAIACKNLGISFVGIEKELEHYNVAKNRLNIK